MQGIFVELSLVIVAGVCMAMIMSLLRQPLIIGHILTGILVGPTVLGLVQSPDTIEALGSFGIALLLFIVGLGLNPKVIKEVGKVSVLTGVGQVVFTSLIGFLLVKSMGFNNITAFYICVALTFSSTIIILKLLTDKKEHNKLYGKISIGFLLVQDVIATFALLIAAASSNGSLSYSGFSWLVLKGTFIVLTIVFIAKYVLIPMSSFLSRSQELLFLFAIAWGLGIGVLFHEQGFSLEVGALIAGVALSNMAYAQEIGSRLRPLRDFFIVVFFIALGAKLNIGDLNGLIGNAGILSLFVLIGNPIIVMIVMGLLGYTKKTSFKSGLAVAQISEFSLIFVLLGQRNGQIDKAAVSLVTVVGIITIAISSYMIIYADQLYGFFEKYLSLFERKKNVKEHEHISKYDAILVGYRRGGSEYIRIFKQMGIKYVVLDYDPEAIDELSRKQIPYLYGDVTDTELLTEIDLTKVRLVVVNITDNETNTFVLQHLEKVNQDCVTICNADSIEEAADLYELGAAYVILPHFIGSEKISHFIKKSGLKKSEFKKYREKHLAYLQSHHEPAHETSE